MANRRTEKELPIEVSNVLLHVKENEGSTEAIVLPYTRYGNVMNRPNVVTEGNTYTGAPFHLLVTDVEEVDDNVIKRYCGDII